MLHSTLGASGMHRWSKCPGSVRLSAGKSQSRSSYAEEGTDAHSLAAECLAKDGDANDFIGHTFGGSVVDPEMAEAVQVYLDAVRQVPGALDIEHRFDLSSVHPGCFGTADAVIWDNAKRLLTVFDYKHGAGIPVNVEGNPQLRYYGLGALINGNYTAERVRLVIVQPRCEHPDGPVRSEDIDAFDLLEFRADLKEFAQATEKADAPLVPGDHCRFCPASYSCPALEKRAQIVAKSEFSPVFAYDPAKLAEALDAIPATEARIKAVREFAYAEAEAGRSPPGYKIVEKMGRRKWRDEAELEAETPSDDWYEPRAFKSPAQLEKVMGKPFVARFTVTESSGHVLVPESDRRAPARITPQLEFTPVAKEIEWQSQH